jgi:hypothetical protein
MTKNTLNEAQNYLNMVKKTLLEDYGIGYEEVNANEVPNDEVAPQEENIASNDERIAQIREIALGGLQDYAHDVDGEEYQFFKKIWLMCDKAVSEKEGVGDSNS